MTYLAAFIYYQVERSPEEMNAHPDEPREILTCVVDDSVDKR